MIVGLFNVTVGTVLLLFTVTEAVPVQPLVVLVTVTVKVPAALTVAVFVPATGTAPALHV